MIDKIRLKRQCKLDTTRFNRHRFIYTTFTDDNEEYAYYKCNLSGVAISYSTRSNYLSLEGRLINLCMPQNRVDTIDLLWAGIAAEDGSSVTMLDDILDNLNRTLYELTGYRMDIRRFEVQYIEFCFNIRTEHVGSYLYMFNDIFKFGRKERYTDYIIEADKDWHTGFYIKTKSDYSSNTKRNYVLNFYNKHHQLCNINEENESDDYRATVSEEDIERSRDILRLEVQCGYYYLRQLKSKHNISGEFADFLDIDLCSSVIQEKYKYFVDKYIYCNFHTYGSAISLINSDSSLDAKNKKLLKDYCLKLAFRSQKKLSASTRRKYEDMLSQLHVYSMFIQPKRLGFISILPSPMAMLDEHVDRMKESREQFIERYNIQERTAVIEDIIDDGVVNLDMDDMDDIFGNSD